MKQYITYCYSPVRQYLAYFAVLVVLSISSVYAVCAENARHTKIDSLTQELIQSTNDSTKVNILATLSASNYSLDPQKGIEYGLQALKLAESIHYLKGIGDANNALGINHWVMYELPQALKYLLTALNTYEYIKDNTGIAKSSNNIGMIYGTVNNLKRAEEYFRKAIIISREANFKTSEVKALLNLAGVYRDSKNNNYAIEYYIKALEVNNLLNDKATDGLILINLAAVYTKFHKYSEAYYTLNRAKDAVKINNDNYLDPAVLFETANMYLSYATDSLQFGKLSFFPNNKRANLDYALNNLQKAKVIFINMNALSALQACYESMYLTHKAMGQTKQALEYYEKSNAIRDSANSTVNKMQFNFYETEREILLRDKQLEVNKFQIADQQKTIYISIALIIIILMILLTITLLLNKKRRYNLELEEKNRVINCKNVELDNLLMNISLQKKQIEISNKKLNEANSSKDKFFSIISHDLRSPFAGILGLSELLVTEIHTMTLQNIKSITQSIHNGSKETYNLLESLLAWAKTQLGEMHIEPVKINILSLGIQVIKSLESAANKKNQILNCGIHPELFGYADENMIQTVLRNLVNNAIKFTPQNGVISITAQGNGELITFSVVDTGIGINEAILLKLFTLNARITTKGTNNESGTGLGLILCKELVEKNEGTIWVQSELGQDSTFYFTIPEYNYTNKTQS